MWVCLVLILLGPCGVGCGGPAKGPLVVFLDGAGWAGSSASVENGLREGGYRGQFETFVWSSGLGPGTDHFLVAQSDGLGQRLARKLERARSASPDARLNVIALSAGTSVVLSALQQMKDGVRVDNVVLLSPSVSDRHDLTKIMHHVRRNLYATCSRNDAILGALIVNADGRGGDPAGLSGFKAPRNRQDVVVRESYSRVFNLPWKPAYLAYNWNGGHTAVTNSKFIAAVIAPRILTDESFPADRDVLAGRDGSSGS